MSLVKIVSLSNGRPFYRNLILCSNSLCNLLSNCLVCIWLSWQCQTFSSDIDESNI